MLGFMTQSVYHKVCIIFTKKLQLSAYVRVRVCVFVFRWGMFQFPWKNDGFQLYLEENIYSVANIKTASSIITNKGKPDEECGGLSREYYLQTPS
jgi:hypothetical protein